MSHTENFTVLGPHRPSDEELRLLSRLGVELYQAGERNEAMKAAHIYFRPGTVDGREAVLSIDFRYSIHHRFPPPEITNGNTNLERWCAVVVGSSMAKLRAAVERGA